MHTVERQGQQQREGQQQQQRRKVPQQQIQSRRSRAREAVMVSSNKGSNYVRSGSSHHAPGYIHGELSR